MDNGHLLLGKSVYNALPYNVRSLVTPYEFPEVFDTESLINQ